MSSAGRAWRRWRYWLPAVAVMAGIFVLSAQSGLSVTEDVDVERPIRVSGHLLAYGVLGGLLLFALARAGRPRWPQALAAWVLSVLYGATDELHQAFVPDRSGRVDDLVVDAIGAAVGIVLAWAALSTIRRRGEGDSGQA
jgi:VanZ family protein